MNDAMVTCELRTGLRCEAGSTVIQHVKNVVSSTGQVTLDHNDSHVIEIPRDDAYLASLHVRDVALLTDRLGRIREWRISNINDGRGDGRNDALVRLELSPVILDMEALGPVYTLIAGRHVYNVGGGNATPQQFCETAIQPYLTAIGATWLTFGTFGFGTARFSFAWAYWSSLQILQALKDKSGGEIELLRVGDTGYTYAIVAARAASRPTVHLYTGKQIRRLIRTRSEERLATVIQPVGAVPNGDFEGATLGRSRWKITALSGTLATLADPNGGDPPIGFDDQFNLPVSRYVLKTDGTLVQITDTIFATQQIQVSSATGLAVGDYIEIRENSSGDIMSELTNPAGVALHGRCVRVVEDTEGRGEANEVPNAFANDWPAATTNSIEFGIFNGTISSTTVTMKGCKPFLFIPAGAMLRLPNGNQFFVAVGGSANVDAAGNVLFICTTTVTATADTGAWLFIDESHLPTGWTKLAGYTNNFTSLMLAGDATLRGDLAGLINGTWAECGTAVDGLPANALIAAGDYLFCTGQSNGRVILQATQVSAGGTARIVFFPSGNADADNVAVTIKRATFANAGKPVFCLGATPGGAGSTQINGPLHTVRFISPMEAIWCTVGYTIFAAGAHTIDSVSGHSSRAGLTILNDATSATLGALSDQNRTIAAGQSINCRLTKQITLTATTRLRPVFTTTGRVDLDPDPAPWCFVEYFMTHIGADPEAPGVNGSHANRLWQLANVKLAELSVEPFTLQVTYAELALLNPDLAYQALEIGQNVIIHASDMAGGQSVEIPCRLTALSYNQIDPTANTATFETLPERLTKNMLNSTQKIFVEVQQDPTNPNALPTAQTSTTPPVETLNAPRFIVDPGQIVLDPGTGQLPLVAFTPPSGLIG